MQQHFVIHWCFSFVAQYSWSTCVFRHCYFSSCVFYFFVWQMFFGYLIWNLQHDLRYLIISHSPTDSYDKLVVHCQNVQRLERMWSPVEYWNWANPARQIPVVQYMTCWKPRARHLVIDLVRVLDVILTRCSSSWGDEKDENAEE